MRREHVRAISMRARNSAVVCLLLASCTGSESSSGAVTRSAIGDTVAVHNHSPEHQATASLRPVMRIGQVEGPPEYAFDGINVFTVGPNGHIYIAEGRGPLRQYSATGDFVSNIARQGEGPGEVRYVTGLAVRRDATLLAVDVGNSRVNVYSATGESIAHWLIPRLRPSYGRNALVVTDADAYVGVNPPLGYDAGRLTFPRPAFARVGPGGMTADTLFVPVRFTEECPVLSEGWFRSGWFEDLRVPYYPKVKWALSPTGLLIAGCPADYSFEILDPETSTVFRVSRAWSPIHPSREERDGFKDVTTPMRNRLFENWQWRGPDVPETRPAYQRFVVAEDGRIWVWPSQPRTRFETDPTWRARGLPPYIWSQPKTGGFDVFEPSGRWIGTVALPPDLPYTPYPDTPDPYIRGDTLWAVTVDSLEVEYLTRFEVVWPQ